MTVFRCSNNIGVGVATCKVCFGSINVFMPGTNITFERSIYNLPDVLVWMAYIYLCSLILFALAEGFPVDRGMYLVAFSFFLQIAIFYPCYVIVDLAITKNQYGRSCHGRARSEGLYTPIGWGHINCCLRPNRAGVPDFVYRIDGQLCLCLFSFQRSMQRGLFWFFFARMFLLCIQWIKKCGEAHEGLIVDFLIVYHTFRFFRGMMAV